MTAKHLKTDLEIQQDIESELAWDTRVGPTEIGIQVKHGIVTLAGTVDSWTKFGAAQEVAHRVEGVRDVANELTVNLGPPAAMTDGQIAASVRAALEGDPAVPEADVHTTVSHGTLTLTGLVGQRRQRDAAERAVTGVPGVWRVVNQIAVAGPDAELGRVGDQAAERREVDGLGDERRPGAPGVLDGLVVGVGADHDRVNGQTPLMEPSHQRGAADPWQAVVSHDDVGGRWRCRLGEGLLGAGRHRGDVAVDLQDLGDVLGKTDVVVDDEDSSWPRGRHG
jgi:osmotically-inducible protein OsmY